MSKNNALSKKKYLTENILFALLLAFCFRATLFKNIPSLSYTTSNVVFGIIFISLLSINILATWNKRRSFFNVYCNTSIALGVYIFVSYIYIHPILWVVIAICFILSIAYSLLILTQQIKSRRNRKKILFNRLVHCAFGSRTIFGLGFILIILIVSATLLFSGSLISSDAKAESSIDSHSWTIEENIESVNNLQPGTWKKLSAKEKASTLQVIANIEASHLGLSHELTVILNTLSEGTIACYSDVTHIIIINVNCFEEFSSQKILNALCHEAYHAYQHNLCNAYDSISDSHKNLLAFRIIEDYKKEFNDYTSGQDDYLTYYTQTCEIEARQYAASATKYYFDYMEKQIPAE